MRHQASASLDQADVLIGNAKGPGVYVGYVGVERLEAAFAVECLGQPPMNGSIVTWVGVNEIGILMCGQPTSDPFAILARSYCTTQ